MIATTLRTAIAILIAAALIPAAGCSPRTAQQKSNRDAVQTRSVGSADAYYFYLAALELERANQKTGALDMMSRAITEDPWAPQLRLSRAQLLLDLNQLDEAMADLNQVLAMDAAHSEALVLVGGIERARNRWELAAEAYRKAIRSDPDNTRLYLLLAETYTRMGRTQDVGKTYAALNRRFPDDVTGLIYLGRWHLIHGSPATGEGFLKRAEELRGDLETPHVLLGRLYDDTLRHEAAIVQYEAVLDINPENISAAFRLALLYTRVDRPEPAQELLFELGLSAGDDKRIINILVDEYIDAEDYADSRTLLAGMRKGAPDSELLHYLSGIAEDALNRPAAALAHLGLVNPASSLFRDATIRSARILKDTGRTGKGIADTRQAIADSPDMAMRYFKLAVLHESIEEYEEALEALATGLALFPGHIQLMYRKGLIFERKGDKANAMTAMRDVIDWDPQHADALNYLGYAYAEMGTRLDEAEALIKTALNIKPQAGYIIDSLGWIYYRQGRYADALPLLQRAIAIEGQDPTILEHLADTLVKLNQWKNALEYYRQSHELHPNARDRQRVVDKMLPLKDKDR